MHWWQHQMSFKIVFQTFFLPYFYDIHRAQDIGVEGVLHVLRSGLLQGAFGHEPSIVNEQVETLRPHKSAHLLGAFFYATKVSSI